MSPPDPEAELARFRAQWREEVARRQAAPAPRSSNRNPAASASASASISTSAPSSTQPAGPGPSSSKNPPPSAQPTIEESGPPPPNFNLDSRTALSGRRLDEDGPEERADPVTALEHYERAVEKESQGSLGDSVSLYRRAFRLDARVHEKYKNKHFPTKPPPPPTTTSTTPSSAPQPPPDLPPTLTDLLTSFSNLSIVPAEPVIPNTPPPPCPLALLPAELLLAIICATGAADPASLPRLASTCRRLAFLVMADDAAWKALVHSPIWGLRGMHYAFAVSVTGGPLEGSEADTALAAEAVDAAATLPLTPLYPTYRSMYRSRPRIRFGGAYISAVNYARPGGNSGSNFSWTEPVLIVTYFRYLRFLRDGRVVSLLTTAEPADVVPLLGWENVGAQGGVMKDALRGRWRVSGDPWGEKVVGEGDGEEREEEGDVHVETEGVVPRYTYRMHFGLGSAGRSGGRNNKLVWKGYWSFNRLTEDWAEFGRKNYRAFYWSRVRSYGMG
ncbi:hypothetical protein EJ06DRAFT_42668 [Trichodelitschia bisporula]|uniref:F-box protein Hrt3/FBXO9 C-terminal domain-containing protein n=1 Tax=Trichodelitschia bisporula TaxID=703511 RepID=A0A6G1HVS0_9PEZI|nr:hypothetical protein EJ06DRAFT_42668 [Trichodelitschia bisporula]